NQQVHPCPDRQREEVLQTIDANPSKPRRRFDLQLSGDAIHLRLSLRQRHLGLEASDDLEVVAKVVAAYSRVGWRHERYPHIHLLRGIDWVTEPPGHDADDVERRQLSGQWLPQHVTTPAKSA